MDAMYPRVLTETGIVGLVAFFALLWTLFRVGLRAYRQATEPYSRGLALGFLFGYVGVLVHAVGSNSFLIVRIMEPFWLFAALVVQNYMAVRASQSVKDGAPLPPRIGGEAKNAGNAVGGSVVTGVGLARFRKP